MHSRDESPVPYVKGLHKIVEGVWAYLQPDGGWGWSNAGLIEGDGESLLVDTLFDLKLTAAMLDTIHTTVPAVSRIGTVVNTHANGDHWYGNALLADSEIIASTKCAEEMKEIPPPLFVGLLARAPNLQKDLREFLKMAFGQFEFDGIETVTATRTFDKELTLQVGGKAVQLLEVGPAHTRGDVIVHLPDDGVVFTGDIVFAGSHPIVWAGPVSNWMAACDRILALDNVRIVVPGHGPISGMGVVREMKRYFQFLAAETRDRFDRGMSPSEAVRELDLGPYSRWAQQERVAANVMALYRDLGADIRADVASVLRHMAQAGC